MIYEFALEPELVARWHDRAEYLFFDEKFCLRSRRIVSAYPKKSWRLLVWDAFNRGPAAANQNAQMRMTELIQYLWQNSVRRHSTFPEIAVWLERAEAEHGQRPFRAIIATSNPRRRPFVVTAQRLIADGHDLWNIPDNPPTLRTAQEMASAVSPLIRLSRHAILIDPYFDPNKQRFRKTLEAVLAICNENVCGLEGIQVELYTSIDRCFKSWERYDDRDPADEELEYNKLVAACQNQLPDLIPASISLKVVIWKQKENGEKLHNRYLLTNLVGVMFGTGSDEADDPDSSESDDIVLLEEGQHATRYRQYSGNHPAFDQVGQPFEITGQRTY